MALLAKAAPSEVHRLAARSGDGVRGRQSSGWWMLAAAAAAVVLWSVSPALALIPFAVALAAATGAALGIPHAMPHDATGWLYVATIFVTCLAPAAGAGGTIVRTASAVGVAGVLIVTARAGQQRRMPALASYAVLVLLVALAVAAVRAPSASYGMARLVNWTMFLPLLFLVVSRPRPRAVAFGVVATCVFQMLGVSLQVLGVLGGTWGGLIVSGQGYDPMNSSWLMRYTGFLQNPNDLALLLSIGTVVLLVTLFAELPVGVKAVCVCLLPLFTVGIVLTGSRGGLVAAVLGSVVVCAALGRRGAVLACAVGLVAVPAASVSGSVALGRVVSSIEDIVQGADGSANARRALWSERSSDLGALITGQGFGGYEAGLFAGQRGFDVSSAAARAATIDNSWLKLGLECGFLGLIAMAALLALALRQAFAGSRQGTSGHLIGTGACGVLIALLWRSFTVDVFDQNPWNAILYLAVGVALTSCATPAPSAASRSTGRPRRHRSAASLRPLASPPRRPPRPRPESSPGPAAREPAGAES